MNMDNIIILRSVFGKVSQSYTLNPCIDPDTGMYPSCVKNIDAHGDMILSDKDKQSGQIFVPINEPIEIVDGTVFDMGNPLQKARWESIKGSGLIAAERFAHDSKGELLIDGSSKRYGKAVLYIERPGVITQTKVNKAKLINKALNYVYGDTAEGRITKCKLLGKNMRNSYPSDVEDYLGEYAKRNPQKIIDLYTGSDTEKRMLFIDALGKGVIREKNGVFMYGDKITLGVTDESVIVYLKQPANQKVVDYITQDTYPEFYEKKTEAVELPKVVTPKK